MEDISCKASLDDEFGIDGHIKMKYLRPIFIAKKESKCIDEILSKNVIEWGLNRFHDLVIKSELKEFFKLEIQNDKYQIIMKSPSGIWRGQQVKVLIGSKLSEITMCGFGFHGNIYYNSDPAGHIFKVMPSLERYVLASNRIDLATVLTILFNMLIDDVNFNIKYNNPCEPIESIIKAIGDPNLSMNTFELELKRTVLETDILDCTEQITATNVPHLMRPTRKIVFKTPELGSKAVFMPLYITSSFKAILSYVSYPKVMKDSNGSNDHCILIDKKYFSIDDEMMSLIRKSRSRIFILSKVSDKEIPYTKKRHDMVFINDRAMRSSYEFGEYDIHLPLVWPQATIFESLDGQIGMIPNVWMPYLDPNDDRWIDQAFMLFIVCALEHMAREFFKIKLQSQINASFTALKSIALAISKLTYEHMWIPDRGIIKMIIFIQRFIRYLASKNLFILEGIINLINYLTETKRISEEMMPDLGYAMFISAVYKASGAESCIDLVKGILHEAVCRAAKGPYKDNSIRHAIIKSDPMLIAASKQVAIIEFLWNYTCHDKKIKDDVIDEFVQTINLYPLNRFVAIFGYDVMRTISPKELANVKCVKIPTSIFVRTMNIVIDGGAYMHFCNFCNSNFITNKPLSERKGQIKGIIHVKLRPDSVEGRDYVYTRSTPVHRNCGNIYNDAKRNALKYAGMLYSPIASIHEDASGKLVIIRKPHVAVPCGNIPYNTLPIYVTKTDSSMIKEVIKRAQTFDKKVQYNYELKEVSMKK